MKSTSDTHRPETTDTPRLLNDAVHHAGKLIQHEVELAKREITNKLSRAFAGVAMIVIAAFLVLSALDVLTAAIVAGIAEAGVPVWASALIVAGISIAVAMILFMVGKSRINMSNLTPETSIKNLRRDINTIKENANA